MYAVCVCIDLPYSADIVIDSSTCITYYICTCQYGEQIKQTLLNVYFISAGTVTMPLQWSIQYITYVSSPNKYPPCYPFPTIEKCSVCESFGFLWIGCRGSSKSISCIWFTKRVWLKIRDDTYIKHSLYIISVCLI